VILFPFGALTLLVWQQEGHLAFKKLGVGLLVLMISVELSMSWSCTTFIIFSSNKI